MISVEEALEKILSLVNTLDAEAKSITECLGQVLAEDIFSPIDVPPMDNAAMDGYAVQFNSIAGATPEQPKVLKIIDEVAAGYISNKKVELGTAVRIMTGAPVPDGADVVVRFEDTDEAQRRATTVGNLTEISVCREVPRGSNIRRAGEDIRKGTLVLNKGKVLRPADIGVLASLGRTTVLVYRRPVVAILATGNELIDIGQPLTPGKIYNSNSYSLMAQVIHYGGIPKILGIAPDDFESLAKSLRRGLDCDLLITSGGVSLGDYDMVKDVLTKEGKISFWTVRMKPGKPLAFGFFETQSGKRIPHLGLPGNPVSAMITFEIFARPVILKMMGKKNWNKPTVKAVIGDTIRNSDGRRIFVRVIVTKRNSEYTATLTGPQGSGILTSMVQANGLAIIPEDVEVVNPGDVVDVMVLDWDEIQA